LKAWRAGFASLIVADFPALFAEFLRKTFRRFHKRCDGHANTLVLIRARRGIFSGASRP
jgi:hypothetical protein